MATTSIADKLAKLEKKIAKRQATIAEEQTQLDKELVGIFCSIPREKVEGCTREVKDKMALFLANDFREDNQ